MNDIRRFAEQLKKTISILKNRLWIELSEDQETIADYNRMQLNRGMRADNTYLPDYSEASVELYHKLPGPIRLYDTGKFWEGIEVKTSENTITITNTNEKLKPPINLQGRYGESIIGISKDNLDDFLESRIMPALYDELEKLF